jgi:hypothetical protein
VCGGKAKCGFDGTCFDSCCREGLTCAKKSPWFWTCAQP